MEGVLHGSGLFSGEEKGGQAEMRAGDPQPPGDSSAFWISSLWLKGGRMVGHGSDRRTGFGPGQAMVCDPRPCSIP